MPTDQTAREFEYVALDAIAESPSNPRKAFDKAPLTELAEDIARRGVLQPLLVRPAPAMGAKKGEYELVFGHRRFRAARLAGLKTVPVMVSKLSDAEVLEVQLMENLKRADLHPLEAADGYRQLHEVHGLSVEEVAKRVGKSTSTIYQALSVSRLGAKARKAWLAGELGAGVARLLARIPAGKAQDAAFAGLRETWNGRALVDTDEAERELRRHMRPLSKAPFPQDDAGLAAKCGACTGCQKRSDAQAALFSDVKMLAHCLDIGCWDAKVASWWKQQEVLGKSGKGPRCLSASETKVAFGDSGSRPQYGSPWVVAGDACPADMKQRAWDKLLGKEAKALTVLALAPSGDVVRLVDAKAASAALRKAGTLKDSERVAASSTSGERRSKSEVEKARAAREQARFLAAVTKELVVKCAEAAEKSDDALSVLPLLARLAATTISRDARERRKLEVDTDSEQWLEAVESEALGHQLGLLVEELLNGHLIYAGMSDDYPGELKHACEVLDVDMGAVEEEVKARAEQEDDE